MTKLGAEIIGQETPLDPRPLFLDELFCKEADHNLLDCESGIRAPGLVTCEPTENVWIRCTGQY